MLEKNGTDTHPSYLQVHILKENGGSFAEQLMKKNNGDRSTCFYDLFILCMAKLLVSVEVDTKRRETLLLFEVMKLF